MSIGKNVKKIREAKGITQEKLAEQLGYSHKSSINKIEMDKSDISTIKLIELSDALGVSPLEILGIKYSTVEIGKDNIIEYVRKYFGDDAATVVEQYAKLNDIGKTKIRDTLSDLTESEKYRK